MEQTVSYQFQSLYITWVIFGGLAFVGFGLGFMFWLDFRTRFSTAGNIAGLVVLLAGSLLGTLFGYQATQPGYFKQLTANEGGVNLRYYLPAADVAVGWSEIERISILDDRLLIQTHQEVAYSSPVVYRGDQDQLLSALTLLMANDSP